MRACAVKCVLLWMLISLSCAANAEDDTAVLFSDAAHCLAAKDFLPHTNATKLAFGYTLDEKSYPREKVLYVVDYPNPSKPRGLVFAVFLAERNKHSHFNIQNNARFALSKSGEDIFFVGPPLGGAWTQEHLVSAIDQIEKQPKVTIPVKELLAKDFSISCEAYTDR
jgi:hypothetical protein